MVDQKELGEGEYDQRSLYEILKKLMKNIV